MSADWDEATRHAVRTPDENPAIPTLCSMFVFKMSVNGVSEPVVVAVDST